MELSVKLHKLNRRVSLVLQRYVMPNKLELPENVVVHLSHHKMGSTWIKNILRDVAAVGGAAVVDLEFDDLAKKRPRIIFDGHSKIDLAGLRMPYKGTHMVRDPRDVLVSAYKYHKKSDEPWLHEKKESLGGVSYQQHLNRLSLEDGLLFELKNSTGDSLRLLRAWGFDDPNILELRYEDVQADYEASFEKIFSHYGFEDKYKPLLLDIAGRHSLEKARKDPSVAYHIQSGASGHWKGKIPPVVLDYFENEYADVLVKMGYKVDI